jgi:hypothetical protein
MCQCTSSAGPFKIELACWEYFGNPNTYDEKRLFVDTQAIYPTAKANSPQLRNYCVTCTIYLVLFGFKAGYCKSLNVKIHPAYWSHLNTLYKFITSSVLPLAIKPKPIE